MKIIFPISPRKYEKIRQIAALAYSPPIYKQNLLLLNSFIGLRAAPHIILYDFFMYNTDYYRDEFL
jgi:hypothetical protein